MNESIRRFLALNVFMCGHCILDAFDGDIKLFAECTHQNIKDAKELYKKLEHVRTNGIHWVDELASEYRALINFYRTPQYAFMHTGLEQQVEVPVIGVSEGDRNHDVEYEGVAGVVINSIIHTIAPVETDAGVRVSDGCFYIRKRCLDAIQADHQVLSRMFKYAYSVVTYGPQGGASCVLKYRDRLSMEIFKPMTPGIFCKYLNDVAEAGINPRDYSRTCLAIPDLLPVYKYCKCVMMMDVYNPGNVVWLIDSGKEFSDARLISLDMSTLCSITSNIEDLSKYGYNGNKDLHGLVKIS